MNSLSAIIHVRLREISRWLIPQVIEELFFPCRICGPLETIDLLKDRLDFHSQRAFSVFVPGKTFCAGVVNCARDRHVPNLGKGADNAIGLGILDV